MELFSLTVLYIVVSIISGVACLTNNGDIIGMAVAGCSAFVLMSVVMAIIIVSYRWKRWFNTLMKTKNKVRMPRAYFKKKEEEAKKKLLSDSASGKHNSIVEPVTRMDDWNTRTRPIPQQVVYEEKDATVDLGEEEVDDEFVIEAELVEDYEVSDKDRENYDPGDKAFVTNEAYTYSTVDSFRKTNQTDNIYRAEVTDFEESTEKDRKSSDDVPHNDDVKITSFYEPVVHL